MKLKNKPWVTALTGLVAMNLCFATPSHHRGHRAKTVATQAAVVHINTADAATLATIKGIGPKKAQRIVAYRQQHGKFKTVNGLTAVRGISKKNLAKLQRQIRL